MKNVFIFDLNILINFSWSRGRRKNCFDFIFKSTTEETTYIAHLSPSIRFLHVIFLVFLLLALILAQGLLQISSLFDTTEGGSADDSQKIMSILSKI